MLAEVMLDSFFLGSLLTAIAVLLYINRCLQSRLQQLGNLIPGPRQIPIIGLFSSPKTGAEVLRHRQSMYERYGTIYRWWTGDLLRIVIVDPDDAETILASMNTLDKGSTYDTMKPWLGTGLLTSTGKKWQLRRKALTPTFHFKILEQFIDVFNAQGGKLLETVEKEVNGQLIDIRPFISNYTLDVICETAMGVKVGAQDSANSPYLTAIKRITSFIADVRFTPKLIGKILLMIKKERERDDILKVLHGFTNSVIKANRSKKNQNTQLNDNSNNETKKKTAFLELLVNLSEKPDSPIKSDEDIREEVDTFMFEGHDTTSSVLCSTLYLLAQHQDVQERVFKEACTFIQNDEDELMYKDLQSMKYIDMVIKEVLRIYPSVPSISRLITTDLKLPSGYTIPAGAQVTIDIYHIHKNPKYFPNPYVFNPDNFSPDNVVGRHPFAFIPFSAGPRNCIGQKFAMLEMKSTICKFIRKYKVEHGGPGTDIKPSTEIVFTSENGFLMKVTKRDK